MAAFESTPSESVIGSMAAFHLIIYGRFWVITEGEREAEAAGG